MFLRSLRKFNFKVNSPSPIIVRVFLVVGWFLLQSMSLYKMQNDATLAQGMRHPEGVRLVFSEIPEIYSKAINTPVLEVFLCTCPLLHRYVEETALGKAKEVASRLAERQDWAVVIGADTVVVCMVISLLWFTLYRIRYWMTRFWRSQGVRQRPGKCSLGKLSSEHRDAMMFFVV